MMRILLLAASISLSLILATASQAAVATEDGEVFAKVGDASISVEEYRQALITSSRNTFYHARPPDNEILAFQKQVADQIINRELLLQQAEKQAITVNSAQIEKELDKYRRRAERRGQALDENSDAWKKLKTQIEQDLLAEKVETVFKENIEMPTDQELQLYYDSNQDKFTEPAQFDLSTILLGVSPSSGKPAWDAARQEATELVANLRAGADFAEMASIHSSDVSAANGGALGYSHKGMFSAAAQEVIEKLEPGQISEPLQVLEGIVIFKLNGRRPARLLEFVDVENRVRELWIREKQKQLWQEYLLGLRAKTHIVIEEKYLTISGRDSAETDRVEHN